MIRDQDRIEYSAKSLWRRTRRWVDVSVREGVLVATGFTAEFEGEVGQPNVSLASVSPSMMPPVVTNP